MDHYLMAALCTRPSRKQSFSAKAAREAEELFYRQHGSALPVFFSMLFNWSRPKVSSQTPSGAPPQNREQALPGNGCACV